MLLEMGRLEKLAEILSHHFIYDSKSVFIYFLCGRALFSLEDGE